jgi:hypothetical protein
VWDHVDPAGATEFVYRFYADSRYAWVGVIVQPRSSGTFKLTVEAAGTFEMNGNRLSLHPVQAARTREDPDDPGGDYADRPFTMHASTVGWYVGEDGKLTIDDPSSGPLTYTRME